jgi:hypothetical protein
MTLMAKETLLLERPFLPRNTPRKFGWHYRLKSALCNLKCAKNERPCFARLFLVFHRRHNAFAALLLGGLRFLKIIPLIVYKLVENVAVINTDVHIALRISA